jgi:hypothetical protein
MGIGGAHEGFGSLRQTIDNINFARGVGGRFLLGPLRRAATAQALNVVEEQQSPHLRSPSLCYGLRCNPPPSAGLSVALAAHPARCVNLRGGDDE